MTRGARGVEHAVRIAVRGGGRLRRIEIELGRRRRAAAWLSLELSDSRAPLIVSVDVGLSS